MSYERDMRHRLTMKYFYTTGSNCTSSLAAVDACLSQSKNNIIYKYLISSSVDFYASASKCNEMSSSRMSEFYKIKNEDVPKLVVDVYGSAHDDGMEVTRWQERPELMINQDNINAVFNEYSSSGG